MPSANPQAGKAPGILMANEQLAKRYLELARCSSPSASIPLLARGAEALAARFTDNRNHN
jgi:4-hydroxy-2-oxoheptanedioate aldolase